MVWSIDIGLIQCDHSQYGDLRDAQATSRTDIKEVGRTNLFTLFL